MWALWWVWLSAAVVLGALEVVLPSYIFLGFAGGAAVTGIALLVAGEALSSSMPGVFLLFAVTSGFCWTILRRLLGVRKGQVKNIDHDINDI